MGADIEVHQLPPNSQLFIPSHRSRKPSYGLVMHSGEKATLDPGLNEPGVINNDDHVIPGSLADVVPLRGDGCKVNGNYLPPGESYKVESNGNILYTLNSTERRKTLFSRLPIIKQVISIVGSIERTFS